MAAQVIITADDGGLSPAVNEAIADLYHKGSISRAAMFAVYGESDVLCRELPTCARVAHVSLSFGRPNTTSAGIARLLDSNGFFLRPTIDQAHSLSSAMATHAAFVMKVAEASEIQAEVQAQFDDVSGGLDTNREYTFHHNIDSFLTPDYYRPEMGILSRRDCVEAGLYAGYRYIFLDRNEGEDLAVERLSEMLIGAIDDSMAAGGLPVEIALHPATSGRDLTGLTSYCDERYIEFRAWQSKPIMTILSQGERLGGRFVFA